MDSGLKEIEILQYVDCNKNGVLLAWDLWLGSQLFSLTISNTHPIACSQGLQNSRGRKVIRGTSAVLLPLNGPLSSRCAGTRAFFNPNIRGRREFYKSRVLSGWEHHLRTMTPCWRIIASSSPFCFLQRGGRQALWAVRDATMTVMNLFYLTDFCISLQPPPYFCSSEVSRPN